MTQHSQPASSVDPSGPIWPRCAASAAVFRGDQVLLVQRGKGALKGFWSLPGGHIEPGETAKAAAQREVREETGIEADISSLVDVHDVIIRGDGDELRAHYLIAVFCGSWLSGEPIAGADELAAEFAPLAALEDGSRYRLTQGAGSIINRARTLLATQPLQRQ